MCNPNLDIVCRFTSSQLFGEEETFAALTPLLDELHEVVYNKKNFNSLLLKLRYALTERFKSYRTSI